MSTFVFSLPERRLGFVPQVVVGFSQAAVLLLQVPPAVPAVRVLAEALSRLDVNAFGVSDRGPGTVISVSILAWTDRSHNPTPADPLNSRSQCALVTMLCLRLQKFCECCFESVMYLRGGGFRPSTFVLSASYLSFLPALCKNMEGK